MTESFTNLPPLISLDRVVLHNFLLRLPTGSQCLIARVYSTDKALNDVQIIPFHKESSETVKDLVESKIQGCLNVRVYT